MNKFENIRKFAVSEDGAVMTDWVVLTAGLVGLGLAVIMSISVGAVDLGDKTTVAIESTKIIDHES
jgi:hypothetical protein